MSQGGDKEINIETWMFSIPRFSKETSILLKESSRRSRCALTPGPYLARLLATTVVCHRAFNY